MYNSQNYGKSQYFETLKTKYDECEQRLYLEKPDPAEMDSQLNVIHIYPSPNKGLDTFSYHLFDNIQQQKITIIFEIKDKVLNEALKIRFESECELDTVVIRKHSKDNSSLLERSFMYGEDAALAKQITTYIAQDIVDKDFSELIVSEFIYRLNMILEEVDKCPDEYSDDSDTVATLEKIIENTSTLLDSLVPEGSSADIKSTLKSLAENVEKMETIAKNLHDEGNKDKGQFKASAKSTATHTVTAHDEPRGIHKLIHKIIECFDWLIQKFTILQKKVTTFAKNPFSLFGKRTSSPEQHQLSIKSKEVNTAKNDKGESGNEGDKASLSAPTYRPG